MYEIKVQSLISYTHSFFVLAFCRDVSNYLIYLQFQKINTSKTDTVNTQRIYMLKLKSRFKRIFQLLFF